MGEGERSRSGCRPVLLGRVAVAVWFNWYNVIFISRRGVLDMRMYHWWGCTTGGGVPLVGVYHWWGCTTGGGVPLVGVYHGCGSRRSF